MFKAAVFCSSDFEKRSWKPWKQTTCLAVFGIVKMDFKQAQLGPGVTRVICFTVFGNIQLRVPENITVNMSGLSLFGRTRDADIVGEASKGDHTLEIAVFNVFGTTNITN